MNREQRAREITDEKIQYNRFKKKEEKKEKPNGKYCLEMTKCLIFILTSSRRL